MSCMVHTILRYGRGLCFYLTCTYKEYFFNFICSHLDHFCFLDLVMTHIHDIN